MDGRLLDDKVLILWVLKKLILGIWNVVKELEMNWIRIDGISVEFRLFLVVWSGI